MLPEALLPVITNANLPSLEILDVRERVDYNDWNGALVGEYDMRYTPEELERMCLEGTGLSVMREAPTW